MPLLKIELRKDRSREELYKLMTIAGDVLVEVLGIPQNDRNIRVMEYDPDLMIFKEPYEILIEILLFKGRSREIKKKFYEALVKTLEQELNIPPKSVFIVMQDQPLENWGVRGGIPADEINLSFKIDV